MENPFNLPSDYQGQAQYPVAPLYPRVPSDDYIAILNSPSRPPQSLGVIFPDESCRHATLYSSLECLPEKLISHTEDWLRRIGRLLEDMGEPSLCLLSEGLSIANIQRFKSKLDKSIVDSLGSGEMERLVQLSEIGSLIFPEVENYNKLKKIMSPPKLLGKQKAVGSGIREMINLLKQQGSEFVNKWIAVSQGNLLGTSDSYAELYNKFKDKDPIITRLF